MRSAPRSTLLVEGKHQQRHGRNCGVASQPVGRLVHGLRRRRGRRDVDRRRPCLLRWVPTTPALGKNSPSSIRRMAEINAQIPELGAKSALLEASARSRRTRHQGGSKSRQRVNSGQRHRPGQRLTAEHPETRPTSWQGRRAHDPPERPKHKPRGRRAGDQPANRRHDGADAGSVSLRVGGDFARRLSHGGGVALVRTPASN